MQGDPSRPRNRAAARTQPQPQHVQRKTKIVNPLGLHARPAARFVKMAAEFDCEIWVQVRENRVNGKSIMGLIMLEAVCGAPIRLEAFGQDAHEAIEKLLELVDNGFYDDDPTE